jgi:hypothetical protein
LLAAAAGGGRESQWTGAFMGGRVLLRGPRKKAHPHTLVSWGQGLAGLCWRRDAPRPDVRW